MIFNCKICGGQLDFNQGDLITTCPYCGVKQALPKIDNDEKLSQLYSVANSYLMNNEFDKAERIFLEIISLKPDDPEGYWQLVMCKYGITYVTDSKNGEKVPTINRTYYSSILDDTNYLKAISLSSPEQKNIYVKTAEYINKVQTGIVSISKKEKPYDIFICYKETNNDGERTEESIKAQEIYNELTNQGYKVFFARITLEDKIGAEYEPYIFAALTSSKVMLCIGSSKDNFESVWVKNEWSRYLRLIQKGEDKIIIPIIIDKALLPEEFANLTPQDMNSKGFVQELIRGIKKIIPIPAEEFARRKKRNKILRRVGMALGVLIMIGCVFSIPTFKKYSAYNEANELYNSKHYAESAWAFQKLGNFKDSETKSKSAEISWRKSVADIAADAFATAKSAGFESINCEATRYGAYIDPNGNIQQFYSKMTDTTDEVDAVHGKVCDIEGLYDDGYLMGTLTFGKDRQEIADNVIQVFKTCEGYVYLKTNGTIDAKKTDDNIVTNGFVSYGEINNGKYTDWKKETKAWNGVVKLAYYNNFDFSSKNASEILIGIKADGTMLVGGNIVNIDINKIDFSNVNNAVGADIAMEYYSTEVDYSIGYPIPASVMIAVIRNDGKAEYYNVSADGTSPKREITLNSKVIDCTFYVENYALNLLCSDGYVYRCNLEDMSTYKLNIGSGNVYIESYMAVNKNGEPRFFMSNDECCLPSSFKTRMYDELSERVD